MFFDKGTEGEFNKKGNLRSNIEFSWIGELSATSIRGFIRNIPNIENEGEKPLSYCLEASDKYGFKCSFFRPYYSFERLQGLQAKIPYGVTIRIEGSVAIRKGSTYFNADRFLWPDGTEILVRYKEGEKEDDAKNDIMEDRN